ncbi:hypothetical protein EV121DRAFT_297741 [Schizophyllum commune]
MAALVRAYEFGTSPAGRNLGKRAWAQSGPPNKPDCCLSAEYLTSDAAYEALDQYLQRDPTLFNKIKDCVGHVYSTFDAEEHKIGIDPLSLDDSNVPLPAVIWETFGNVDPTDIALFYGQPLTVDEYHADGGGLAAAGGEEDILMFDARREHYSGQNLPTS